MASLSSNAEEGHQKFSFKDSSGGLNGENQQSRGWDEISSGQVKCFLLWN